MKGTPHPRSDTLKAMDKIKAEALSPAGPPRVEPRIHRRILKFLNSATRPRTSCTHRDGSPGTKNVAHEDNPEERGAKPEPIFEAALAKTIFAKREESSAFGFHHIRELFEIERFSRVQFEYLLHLFGHETYGHWDTLPYDTQQPNGASVDVGHAALLHTGKVLFIPADYNSAGWPTPIWDPSDEVNPKFEYPVANPAYSLFCAGQAFLSDGKLLVVGGGGDRNGGMAYRGLLRLRGDRELARSSGPYRGSRGG